MAGVRRNPVRRPKKVTSTRSRPRWPVEQHGDDAVRRQQAPDSQRGVEHLADLERLDPERLAHPPPDVADHRARFRLADDGQRMPVQEPERDAAELPVAEVSTDDHDAAAQRQQIVESAAVEAGHQRFELAPAHDEAADEVDRVPAVAAVGQERQPLQLALGRAGPHDPQIVDNGACAVAHEPVRQPCPGVADSVAAHPWEVRDQVVRGAEDQPVVQRARVPAHGRQIGIMAHRRSP